MPRPKKATVKPSWLTEQDEAWVRESHQQMVLERKLWTDDADQFYGDHAGKWVAIRDGKVVHSEVGDDEFEAWLDANDPDRRRYLIRHVPNADAEFAF